MKRVSFLFHLLLFSSQAFAQYHIRESDIHCRKRLVRSVPLNYQDNQKLFGRDNMLVRVLLDAYEKRDLTGYLSQSCNDTLDYQHFFQQVQEMSCDSSQVHFRGIFTMIELNEDLIVDKNRSEILFQPVSLSLMIQDRDNYIGLTESIVTFRYADCLKVFRNDPRAYARNRINGGSRINFSEVFLMHLYASSIVKIGDPEDLYFDQMSGNYMQSFMIGKFEENALTDYLYNLFHPR